MTWSDQSQQSDIWGAASEGSNAWSEIATRLLVRVTEAAVVRITEDGQLRCSTIIGNHTWTGQSEDTGAWSAQSEVSPGWTEQ